jgi:hypothetical protein
MSLSFALRLDLEPQERHSVNTFISEIITVILCAYECVSECMSELVGGCLNFDKIQDPFLTRARSLVQLYRLPSPYAVLCIFWVTAIMQITTKINF